ncbi:UNVERIFIED_CONTAM: hypothetical protein HDU68_011178 [Siphonaria sp. JEL0065]|nr:hypothetical protein HDU68_011178 [Siphonaria sp. JEL0065]
MPKKRDAATIAQEKAAKEALKLQRQREKDIKKALQDKKREEREAARAAAAAAKATRTPRFVWNENASLQVVALVSALRNKHQEMSAQTPGFIAWTKYLEQGIPQLQKDAIYDELGNLSAETVLNRYEALHHKCKTGGGGLEDCHAQECITRGLYDEMLEFMGNNAATDEDEGEQSDSIDAGSNGAESDGSGSDGEERDNEEVSQGISREPHWNGSGSTSLEQVGIDASLFDFPGQNAPKLDGN